MKEAPVVRIVRKKTTHAAHHGGAWKVAYADFVTALMAFFLVMWILGMDQQLKEEIQSYFNDPYSSSRTMAGISQLSSGGRSPIAAGDIGPGAANWHQLAMVAQQERLETVQNELKQELARRPDLSHLRQHVDTTVGASGLKIELIEARDSLFFETGSAELPSAAREALAVIARHLGKLANPVVIEGHTDVRPYSGKADYSNWELSSDRANAARRAMEATGLRPHQVVEVRGYADTQLRDPRHPQSPNNRRVSILVNYGEDTPEPGTDGASEDAVPAKKHPFAVEVKPK
jgi:chemotaxis protein MotB